VDRVVLMDVHLVAEESCSSCSRVRDQGLFVREIQLECLTQELCDLLLDSLGLRARTRESEQEVVCVSDVAQPAVRGVLGIDGWQPLRRLAQNGGFSVSTLLVPLV